ncbi:MAG: SDR family NAD(P)-dependent oxidoreductase [Alphaproteobacteria bacterium]
MRWDLENKTALVTGAGGGLGQAVALYLAQQRVAVAALDRDAAGAERTVATVEQAGSRGIALQADVSDSRQVADAVARAREKLGPLDYLVNIAGFFEAAPIQDITDEQWQRMLDVHLGGTFRCCRAILPQMMERRAGRIVNIASVQAYGAGFGYLAPSTHYAMAKAGIIGLTKSLAREVGPHGITVNAVAPTATETALWRGNTAEADLEKRRVERAKVIPLGRIAQPADVAEAILFLLSPASSFVTGHVVNLTGGELMV